MRAARRVPTHQGGNVVGAATRQRKTVVAMRLEGRDAAHLIPMAIHETDLQGDSLSASHDSTMEDVARVTCDVVWTHSAAHDNCRAGVQSGHQSRRDRCGNRTVALAAPVGDPA